LLKEEKEKRSKFMRKNFKQRHHIGNRSTLDKLVLRDSADWIDDFNATLVIQLFDSDCDLPESIFALMIGSGLI
jgi:hypothetical protein